MNPSIVIDACVVASLIHPERQSAAAKDCIKRLTAEGYLFFVPDIFLYELLAVAKYKNADIRQTLEVYEHLHNSVLKSVPLSKEIALKASEIVDSGHPKSGFPSFYDASYHALALLMQTHFITSDHRHYAKTQQFGAVVMLEDWSKIIEQ